MNVLDSVKLAVACWVTAFVVGLLLTFSFRGGVAGATGAVIGALGMYWNMHRS